jgi:hypothetical protein
MLRPLISSRRNTDDFPETRGKRQALCKERKTAPCHVQSCEIKVFTTVKYDKNKSSENQVDKNIIVDVGFYSDSFVIRTELF